MLATVASYLALGQPTFQVIDWEGYLNSSLETVENPNKTSELEIIKLIPAKSWIIVKIK